MSVIYILRHPHNPDVCKIGQTATGARTRTSYQKIRWSVYAEFPVAEERRVGAEKYIHDQLAAKNVNIGGGAREIFSLSPTAAKVEVEALLGHFIGQLVNDVSDRDYWKYVATDEECRKHVCDQAKPLTGSKLNELKKAMQNLCDFTSTSSHRMSFGQTRSIANEYGIQVKKIRGFSPYEIHYGARRESISPEHFEDMDEYTLRQFSKLITRGAWATGSSWPNDEVTPVWRGDGNRRRRRNRFEPVVMSFDAITTSARQYEIDVKDLGEAYELVYDGFAAYISAGYFDYLDESTLQSFCRLIVGDRTKLPQNKTSASSDLPEGFVRCRQCGALNELPGTVLYICRLCKAQQPR